MLLVYSSANDLLFDLITNLSQKSEHFKRSIQMVRFYNKVVFLLQRKKIETEEKKMRLAQK